MEEKSAAVGLGANRPDSRFVTITGQVPIEDLKNRISAITKLADSVQVNIRGDAGRIISAVTELSSSLRIISASVALRRPDSVAASLRGDTPIS